jgi:AcrR family transcriptional regulator
MPDRPPDRRVRRTHRRLKEALLELIEERDFDRITVEDITERADVARSTFYSHFGSKEELLFSGFDAWLMGLADTPPARPSPPATPPSVPSASVENPSFRFSLPLLRHMAGHGRFAGALLLSPGGRLRLRLTELIAEVIRRELERGGTPAATGAAAGVGRSTPAAAPTTPAPARRTRRTASPASAATPPSLSPAEAHDAQAFLLASAFLGLAAWWLTSGKGLPPERIDELFQRTVGGAP